jgi:16S rRNA (cytidine1402-2'-O)-methyltransferase
MGILYIVATPIGNMQDITLRAIEVLKSVDAILCEDTRKTGLLLKKIASQGETLQGKKLVSYYEQNELQRIPEAINALKNGLNIALVSDAGTPAISDPGFKLIRECIKEGIKVESIPGPCSVISALVSSGLPTDKFLFVGYPPHKEGHRKQFFEKIKSSMSVLKTTLIMFEAPHKLIRTLSEMKDVFGDIDIVICRELTKVYEEIRRETIAKSLEHFMKILPKGEFVILFHP